MHACMHVCMYSAQAVRDVCIYVRMYTNMYTYILYIRIFYIYEYSDMYTNMHMRHQHPSTRCYTAARLLVIYRMCYDRMSSLTIECVLLLSIQAHAAIQWRGSS